MAKEERASKMDPNSEAFQMRAQWKKTDECAKMWHKRWAWRLEAQKEEAKETEAVRAKARDVVYRAPEKTEDPRKLKPVPVTSTGFVGWVASKPEFKLEVYTNWMTKIPLFAPYPWEKPDYFEKKKEND